MQRLHTACLGELTPAVKTPRYQREALRPGILHFGLGAFHRAHQAVYTDDAIAASGGDWGIIGVSLRSTAVARQLTPQDCLYSVLGEDGDRCELRVVGSVLQVLVAPEDPASVVAAIADPSIRVLTLTITEKGYALAADGRSLDREDQGIRADLADPESPSSAIGLLALGLRRRVAAGGAPLTLLSCDNLSGNSGLLRGVLVEYLDSSFPAVLPWLESGAAFPCSMVDRIVPAMTPEQKQRQSAMLGALDEAAVRTEPFSQWIIEDDFAAGRPGWEAAGARLVSNIRPYEDIKLRLLNAGHSAIAYCGLLSGSETVDEVMADPVLGVFIEALMARDLMPVLDVPDTFDLSAYGDQLLARFRNERLGHRCRQIAMDGSEKIAQRWLPTLQVANAPLLAKALSVWVCCVLCSDIVIEDPREAELLAARASDGSRSQRVARVLACARITPRTLAGFEALCSDVEQNLDMIEEQGLSALLAACGVCR